jgi:hypothetical protein
MGFTLDQAGACRRCLSEAQFAELGKFHYLWAEQIFSYGDSDAGPMTQPDLPNRSEAIRRLVELGLKAKK